MAVGWTSLTVAMSATCFMRLTLHLRLTLGRTCWAGLTLWASASPTKEYVALQWFYPFNFGLDGVTIPGNEEFRDVKFVRQDPEGFFNPCTVQVHNVTGAAVMTTVHKQLPHLEPGFMVPLLRFMCISLDWLFVGWNTRCH